MSDLITRTARLVPYGKRPKQVPSFVTAYTYEPLADDPGAELGNLYVVIEVLVSGRASEEVADLIIETAGDQYYNQHRENKDVLSKFETAVKAVNSELAEHVSRGNAAWIGKLSAVIGVQSGGEIHVTHTGSAEGFLYRGKSSTRIVSGGSTRPGTPSKTFASIASGQLEAGDRLLLATPALIHQVPLDRLQTIVGHNGPNAAIAEITDLLKGAATDRIAALVIELTTPELAALQVRSEQPSEIQLGTPDSPLEAVKLVTEPLARQSLESSKKVAHAARTSWQRAKPQARSLGLAAADALRQALSTTKGRRQALAIIAVLAVLGVAGLWRTLHGQSTTRIFTSYQAAYAEFTRGRDQAATGDKAGARSNLTAAQRDLAALKSHEHEIDSKLAHTTLPESEPKTYASLTSEVTQALDQLEGLQHAKPTTVVNLTTKNHAQHFEVAGSKAYVIATGSEPSIAIVNLSSDTVTQSNSDLSRINDVVATTLSSNNDGIFILTSKPSVWFYRFATDSITEQKVSYGSWPSAVAIASYASNLYLLSPDGQIYKHVKNATGYSPKVLYNPGGPGGSGFTALAVDGNVYAGLPGSLQQYLAGSLKQTTSLPDGLGGIVNLRTSSKDDLLTGTSTKTGRVVTVAITGTQPSFQHQTELSGITTIYDAAYDSATGTYYALTDGRLVRFTTP